MKSPRPVCRCDNARNIQNTLPRISVSPGFFEALARLLLIGGSVVGSLATAAGSQTVVCYRPQREVMADLPKPGNAAAASSGFWFAVKKVASRLLDWFTIQPLAVRLTVLAVAVLIPVTG